MDADVAVIGLGHAGIEAALAAAKLGLQVAAIVPDPARIGWMSCNPAIGGSGKSQLVAELDALGGSMARAADATGIQFRRLNASRGAAVHANRALCDRLAYAREQRRVVEAQPGLSVLATSAEGLLVESGRVRGVRLPGGEVLRAKAVVLTAGTFLSAVLHTGEVTTDGGRVGEAPARGLSEDLRSLGLRLGRFKTGTPPRLVAGSIDASKLELQPGDDPPRPMSAWTAGAFPRLPQRACGLTYTGERTHEVVRRNLHRSPLFQGRIVGRGPRYCPSLEDKVVRFAERPRHLVYLEPEGVDSPRVYPAGLSTSLPADVQLELLRTIPGLEQVELAEPGYAVEYDHVPAVQLTRSLQVGETGLFLAGQVNGTSGYEEAAVQGLWAGVNAARAVRGEPAWGPPRERSHIAVLIDDLLASEPGEPVRMFTSRAENRLELREGNADLRLAVEGHRLGLLDDAQLAQVESRRRRLDGLERDLGGARAGAAAAALSDALAEPVAEGTSLAAVLARPRARWEDVRPLLAGAAALEPRDAEELEARLKYAGYTRRQSAANERVAQQAAWTIPAGFSFAGLAGLTAEAQERLGRARPATLGDAGRVPGITAGALAALAVHLSRFRRAGGCG